MSKENLVVIHLTAAPEEAAGKVTYDLHRILLSSGYESWIMTSVPGPRREGVIRFHRSRIGVKLYHYWRIFKFRLRGFKPVRLQRNPDYSFNVYTESEYYQSKYIAKKLPAKPDIIIVHFYDGMLNTATIVRLAKVTGARVLWLMMDMAPFTGGCHYSWGCLGYTEKCGRCPALASKDENDYSRNQWKSRYELLCDSAIEYVAGSRYQHEQALNSSLLRNSMIHKIMLGYDSVKLTPLMNAEAIRRKYSLSNNKKIIMFASAYLSEKRKGYSDFIEGMRKLAASQSKEEHDEIYILIVGRGEKRAVCECYEQKNMEFMDGDSFSEIISAIDLVVCPTLEDSGPSIVSQALMSGVPVVMYNTGIAEDVVRNGVNGYFVKKGDVRALADAVGKVISLSDDQYADMKRNARATAVEQFDSKKIADEWKQLLEWKSGE
ncbi:MAG TPA: glycosyltransferase [Bacteroidota bacterium]|nr:glycosyltransferase [Bacteroidota bacterium]